MEFTVVLLLKKKILLGCNNINNFSKGLFIIKYNNKFSLSSQITIWIYSSIEYEGLSRYLKLGLMNYYKILIVMK